MYVYTYIYIYIYVHVYIYIYIEGAFKKIHVFLVSEQQAEPADAQDGGQLKPNYNGPTALKHPALPHLDRYVNTLPRALKKRQTRRRGE